MRKIIGVVGDVNFANNGIKKEKALDLGKRLIDNGYRIAHGGLGDIANAISEGARSSPSYLDGDLIAVLPGFDPQDAAGTADIVLATGLDMGRNIILANSDAVIAIGGGAGTLSEMAFSWALKRPIIAFDVAGWSGDLAGKRLDRRKRCDWSEDAVISVGDAEEAIRILEGILPIYTKRHGGIRCGNGKDRDKTIT